MGKRRKPSRKGSYQTIGEIRMAGSDNMDAIIDKLIGDPKLIEQSKAPFDPSMGSNDVKREVLNERQRLNKELISQGLRMNGSGGLEQPVNNLGLFRMGGKNVPGPIVVNDGSIEKRTLVDVEMNPITNNPEISIAREANGQPFVVEYGVHTPRNNPLDANEIIDQQIMERMGYNVTPNPYGYKRGEADWIVEKNGRVRRVDSMVAPNNSRNISAHLFTNLVPSPRVADNKLIDTVKSDMDRGIRSGMNPVDAIRSLGPKYQTPPSYTTSGKIIQAELDPKDPAKYDSLMVSEYPFDVMTNNDRNMRPDRMTTAPSGVISVNLDAALEAVRNNMQRDIRYSVVTGGGQNRGWSRVQVKPQLPKNMVVNGTPLVRKLQEMDPRLGQFLDRGGLDWVIRPTQ